MAHGGMRWVAVLCCVLAGGCRVTPSTGPAGVGVGEAREAREAREAETGDEAGLRRFLEGAIGRANGVASGFDDRTYVQRLEARRAIYFVPEEPAKAEEGPIIPDATVEAEPQEPPANAIKKEWTDRYWLAQQFSYRYVLVCAGPVVAVPGREGTCRAKVFLRFISTSRIGQDAEVQPVPEAPEGMEVWQSRSKFFGTSSFSGLRGWRRELPAAEPPGDAPDPRDEGAKRALSDMGKAPTKEMLLELEARWDSGTRQWRIREDGWSMAITSQPKRLKDPGRGPGVYELPETRPATEPAGQ